MMAVGVTALVGIGIGILGVFDGDLYVVGLLLLFTAGIGLLVRLWDVASRLR